MNIAEIIKKEDVVLNHEGAEAFRMTPEMELYTAVVTSALEDSSYEGKPERVARITSLVPKVDPGFVARLAVYARREMNLRTIPMVLLVELARIHNGDDLVPRAVRGTVLRADEIAELLMCYQWLNPSGDVKKLARLSRGIQNGLKDAFNSFDEYQFAKYDRKDQPVKLRDALFLVHPKAKDEAQQALFDKIAAGTLETPYTWETELSALGQKEFETPEAKAAAFKAKWEELIESRKMGYMATLRNLRNILEAGVDADHVTQVCDYLSDPGQVRRSRQFPFRFLSAYIENRKVDSVHTAAVMTALEKAALASAENIAGFGPESSVLLACDVSGSMQSSVSRKSSVQLYDIGLMLAMLLKSRCQTVMSGMFGDTWKVVNLPQEGILANTVELRRREGEVGYSTNGHLVVDYLVNTRTRMDKVMIFTDCQLWNSYGGKSNIRTSWLKYREMFPEAKLYLFDMAGYGQSPLRLEEDGVTLIAGWSDKVFDILDAVEHGSTAIEEINKIEL